MSRRKRQMPKRRRFSEQSRPRDFVLDFEYRPVNRPGMSPAELAQWDQVLAEGDLELVGSWLLDHGFEFRVDLGDSYYHVGPVSC